jgi:hypothetical protein
VVIAVGAVVVVIAVMVGRYSLTLESHTVRLQLAPAAIPGPSGPPAVNH